MALSLGQVFIDTAYLDKPLPLYIGFPVIAILSTLITISVALITEPTDTETLKDFYKKVQPAGLWKSVSAQVKSENPGFKKQTTFARDAFNTLVAAVGITSLYVAMLYIVLHRLNIGFTLLAMTVLSTIILFFTWYKHLPPPSVSVSEDQEAA